jgi:hypothetical protein
MPGQALVLLRQFRALLIDYFTEDELDTLCLDLQGDYETVPGKGKGKEVRAREIVAHFDHRDRLPDVVDWCLQQRPNLSAELTGLRKQFGASAASISSVSAPAPRRAKLFIAYKRHANPDSRLAQVLHDSLSARGHQVFIDVTMRAGAAWLDQIDQQIRDSDFLIVLLSKSSVDSEMVRAEVARAAEYRDAQGRPHTLPVRVDYEGMLPYAISAFVSPLQYLTWSAPPDDERVQVDILAAIEGGLPERPPIEPMPTRQDAVVSDDGRIVSGVTDRDQLHPPLPEFDPRFLDDLPTPGGTVKLSDRLYIARSADDRLKREVAKPGTTTIIRAARQTGKSSLLVRGVQHACGRGFRTLCFDFQSFDSRRLASLDLLLRDLGEFIAGKLRLSVDVEQLWRSSLPPQEKLTNLFEEHVLLTVDQPLVLALDEADRLVGTGLSRDFFSLVRAWHNNRALYDEWNKLNIVLVISTEPYLLINDISQSPFNVGLTLYLEDFTEAQVADLNRRHGSPVKERELPQTMELLNGHPYLNRKALYTMVTEKMAWADLARVAASDQGPFADHLRHHFWLLRNAQELREALKQVVRHDRCVDDVSFFRLLQAGLVKGSGDVCRCRCGLYEQYFKDKL